MKQFIGVLAIGLATSAASFAAVCAAGTLTSYTLGVNKDCTIDDKRFVNAGYVPGGGPTTANINVTPLTDIANPGFRFSDDWAVGSGGGMPTDINSAFAFYVELLPGGKKIKDTSFDLIVGTGPLNTGTIFLTEDICPGGNSLIGCAAGVKTLQVKVDKNTNVLLPIGASTSFAEVDKAFVRMRLSMSSGGGIEFEKVSSFRVRVSEVPEPDLLLLAGLFLTGVLFLRLRPAFRRAG
jgi:hypothetical protein